MTTTTTTATETNKSTAIVKPVVEKKEILMSKGAKELLKKLYVLRSYSGFEEPVRNFIISFLDQLHIPYVNYNGNILGFNHPGAPLFSAHMDMVNTEGYKLKAKEDKVPPEYVFTIDAETCIRLYKDKEKKHQTSLGADDKNGIWVILNLLALKKKINFAFCHSEETGGTGSTQIVQDEECGKFIENCKYCVVIDRRNAHDIIGYSNEYCLCLDDRLENFAKEKGFKFKSETGSVSDANRFSTLIECINISCGYYNPHSSTEYTNLNELWNTLQFCIKIVDEFVYQSASAERLQKFKKCSCPYKKAYSTATYYSAYRKKDEEEDDPRSTYARSILTSSEKKTQKKKTKTQVTTTADGTGTNRTNKINALSNVMLNEYLRMAIEEGAVYCSEISGYIVPLYSEDDLPKGTTERDILCSIDCDCDDSDKVGLLIQSAVDALFMAYYNGGNGCPIYGVCTNCGDVQNITSYIRYLV